MKPLSSLLRAGIGFVCGLLLLLLSLDAHAHNSSKGISAVKVKLATNNVDIQIALSFPDIDRLLVFDKNKDELVTKEEIEATLVELRQLISKEFEVFFDGHRMKPDDLTAVRQESNFEIHLKFDNIPRPRIKTRSVYMLKMLPEHQEFLTFANDKDTVLAEFILDPKNIEKEWVWEGSPVLAGSTSGGTGTSGDNTGSGGKSIFGTFLFKGIHHILIDDNFITDHLLFLLALLVVCEKFKDVVKIITSFTIAHSLTLALATLNIVRIKSSIVETLIAATIIYVGLENIFRLKTLKWRWAVTFAFGLIHGFGFASVLQDMLGRGSIVLPLVAFNLGVEVGQILVAAVVLPIFFFIRKHPAINARWVPISSAVVVALGAWWLIERIKANFL